MEISNTLRESVKKDFGIDLFEDISKINKKYDAVLLFDVIEHVPNPINFIQQMGFLLKKGGKLIIETPDSNNFWTTKIFKEKWDYLLPDEHLNLLSKKSLNYLLERKGFYDIKYINRFSNYNLALLKLGSYSLINISRQIPIIKKIKKIDEYNQSINYFQNLKSISVSDPEFPQYSKNFRSLKRNLTFKNKMTCIAIKK